MLQTLASLFLSIDFLAAAIRFSTPLLGASLGESISERAGAVNVCLEGMMLCGALGAVLGSYFTGSPWVGLLCAILAGTLVGFVQAFFSVTLAVNQVVVGVALNIGGLGVTTYTMRSVFGLTLSPQVNGFDPLPVPILSQIPILGPVLFNQSVLVYLTYLMVVVAGFTLMRTKKGLNLRAVGEHPEAATSVGISVPRTRYLAILLCGALAGMAGSFFSLVQLNTFIEGMTGGRGFIALAVVVVGKWIPGGLCWLRCCSACWMLWPCAPRRWQSGCPITCFSPCHTWSRCSCTRGLWA